MKAPRIFIRRNGLGNPLIERLVILLILTAIATIAVPFYQGIIQRARAVSAVNTLRQISAAEAMYHLRNNRYAGSFSELFQKGFLLTNLSDGPDHDGYKFVLVSTNDQQWHVTAEPLNSSPERRYFFIDQSGVIKCEIGKPATVSSPSI